MSISPQGYSLGEEPKAKNPFWDGSGEDGDVNRIYAKATVDENVGTPSVQTTKSVDGHDITFGFEFHNLKGRDGTDGRDGINGTNGTDGVSPTITVTDITGGHSVSITDATGIHSFDVMNGQNGRDGKDGTNGTDGRDGTDGVSPSVSVSDITGGHRITVTDATGSETFDVMNGADGRDGTTPEVTITATQGGETVPVTKTGSGASQSFDFAFPGGGGGGTGSLVGWGPEVTSTVNYPVVKNIKKLTTEAYSESGINLSGQLNDDQWQSIFVSGSCDISVNANELLSTNSTVKMGEKDNAGMSNWTSVDGFEIDNISITDNSSVWTLSDVQAEVQYLSDTGTFITGLSIKLTATATDGTTTKTVTGNVSISFSSNIGYTTVTTYQNLVVV